MTAVATATRVLAWAAEPTGPPPTGPLWDAPRLATPPASVTAMAAQLARRTAALLGAGSPPFGTKDPIGLGVVFLAAAVGGRHQSSPAAMLARTVPPFAGLRSDHRWYDLIARHGLVSAVSAVLDEHPAEDEPGQALRGALLDASPLTAVLYRPPLRLLLAGTTGHAVDTTLALLRQPRGREVLAAGLAAWSPLPPVLSWRAGLLAQLRHDHQDLLLDVYLMARMRFAAEWDERIAWAGRQAGRRDAADPLAIETLRFWAPLAALEHANAGPLSALRPLLTGQDKALALVRKFRLDQAGAA